MKILDRREGVISIIFCTIVFLISFFIFNMTTQEAIENNIEKQLYAVNKQNNELAKIKIEGILKNKLEIFTENLIDSGSLENNEIDNKELIKLIEYFKSENAIPIIGIILDNEGIFIGENNERIYFDKEVIYDILSNYKSIFKYSTDKKDYLIVKNRTKDKDEKEITTLYMYENGMKNNDLIIPV